MSPSNKRLRLSSIARCRAAKRPLDNLESYVRSVRHAEERLRKDLREAEQGLAQEKEYSSRVKRERDDLRKEKKEVLEENHIPMPLCKYFVTPKVHTQVMRLLLGKTPTSSCSPAGLVQCKVPVLCSLIHR